MPRHRLTDREFNAIRHLLPKQRTGKKGRPWVDHRSVIDGIFWILKTGSPWRDLPEEFGKWQTVYARFRRWNLEGLWDRVYNAILRRLDKLDRTLWCVDGSVIRAHRCAAGMIPQSEENDELVALGRSRGGYSTKIHILCDGQGTLLGITATGGQRHESTELENLIDHCELSLHRYDSRPDAIAGDKGYSSHAIRDRLRELGIKPVIGSKSNESREEEFDREAYRRRNIVERLIGWLKESRRVSTRYDKLACSYLAFVQLAAMRRALKLI
ncbi:IS5 family transposase [Crateriforma conspicua]|uniref:Transposase DDE domain protein n=1 Tax=Crateriforma conspicua TaxID=2527996 RepID=A0A5C5XRS4_9PLAN|nr:IS5 family transposase [Crateriforma conspicua]TWT65550.1 Transposase DDE domain protein [Crateriforma conspicua]